MQIKTADAISHPLEGRSIPSVSRGVEPLRLFLPTGWDAKWYSSVVAQRAKWTLTLWRANSTLNYPREWKRVHTKTCTYIFTAALFINNPLETSQTATSR